MSGALYTTEILRLATSIPHLGVLDTPDARVERRAPVCGSRVSVDMIMDENGRVSAFAQTVNACALGQASAALLGSVVIGRNAPELAAFRDGLAALLGGATNSVPQLPALDLFTAAQGHSARHASILLPFGAAAEAALIAQQRHQHAA